MRSFRHTPVWKKWFYSYTMIILILLVIIFAAQAVWGMYLNMRVSTNKVNDLKEEKRYLENREVELVAASARLETEKGTKEEIVKKFNVAQEGEEVIIILEPQNGAVVETIEDEDEGFFSRFFFWR